MNATTEKGFDEYLTDDDVVATEEYVAEDRNPFYSVVFWGVNGFILLMLIGVCAWWYCFGAKDNLRRMSARRRETDLEYQRALQERIDAERAAKTDSPEKRLERLRKSFQRCRVTMVVEKTDLIGCDEMERVHAVCAPSKANNANEEDGTEHANNIDMAVETGKNTENNDLEAVEKGESNSQVGRAIVDTEEQEDLSEMPTGYLVLRPSGSESGGHKRGHKVPNCCAICLSEYEAGEVVVWSPNPECKHCFHLDCITDWLVKIQDGTPCPCCRFEFTDLKQHRRERKIKWAAGDTFDLGSIGI